MTACPWPVAQLVPHSGDAILIDTVDDWDEETLRATAVVKPDGLYSNADGSLPPWMGLEIMAQAVGAWAGCQARHHGQQVGLGFLLGTRRYECHVRGFAAGTRLTIHVAQSLRDAAGMGVFECELRADARLLASARLNVYQPADAGAFTREPAPDATGADVPPGATTAGDPLTLDGRAAGTATASSRSPSANRDSAP
ncbi:3-hydroxylacyl-ACP dehydratase [Bordetella sputigena]|uniref:ApeP family dehydratase n=1 Tax=Bordetella sputigena TaxID=1416810 RepID=UPI0039F0F0E5